MPNGRPERKNGAQKRKVDKSGLGRAIINRKSRAARDALDPTLVSFTRRPPRAHLESCRLTRPSRPTQNTSTIEAGLSSVTQENDLDEFLSTAQLADTDFSAGASTFARAASRPSS